MFVQTKNKFKFILLLGLILTAGLLYLSNIKESPVEAPVEVEEVNIIDVSEPVIDEPILPSLPVSLMKPEVQEVPETQTSPEVQVVPEVSTSSIEKKVDVINIITPFTSQAPLFKWSDPRQQDGCEEASALMAMAWVEGVSGYSAAEWEKKIIDLADFEQDKYGEHRDVSVLDVVNWIFKDYFSYDQVEIVDIKNSAQIVAELETGNLVLVPVNGQALANPNFTPPGPEHHFLVITGYDYQTEEFITNDPGTRLGKGYRYKDQIIFKALRSYPTGYHDEYDQLKKEAIIVSR